MYMNNIKCAICGFEATNLVSHIIRKHKMKCSDYKSMFGNGPLLVYTDEQKLRISIKTKEVSNRPEVRKKNSDAQKNGGSIFTTAYWVNKHNLSIDEATLKVKEIQTENALKSSNKMLTDRSWMNVDYWVNKHGYTEIEAKDIISKTQSKLSSKSSKFKGKKRTQESKDNISNSMRSFISRVGKSEWAKHFGEFSGKSKSEIEVFEYIKNNINGKIKSNVCIGNYIVDMIYENKILEFNGDLWHANPLIYKPTDVVKMLNETAESRWLRDEIRTKYLMDNGYSVMVVWENDWNKNRDKVILEIKKYYEISN